jgi:hypothetical protein
MEFVRARHGETGHLAALPEGSLALGMHPGWVKVDGPVPDGPKVAVLRPAVEEPTEDEKTGDGKKPPQETKTAGGKSAEKKE